MLRFFFLSVWRGVLFNCTESWNVVELMNRIFECRPDLPKDGVEEFTESGSGLIYA